MDQRTRMIAEVERWRHSGLTRKEFSEQLGMKLATFSYWVWRTKEEKSKGFVPLVPEKVSSGSEIELIYPDGVRLKVAASDPGLLSRLIH